MELDRQIDPDDKIVVLKTAPILLRMEASLMRRTKERATEEKCSISDLIREALRYYLDKKS